MIRKIAWNAFKNTGNLDTFLEFKQIQDTENQIHLQEAKKNGNNKIEWDNNCRK